MQTKGHTDIQVTSHYHRGCFNILTGSKSTAAFLRTLVVELPVHGKTYCLSLRPSMPEKPRIWVRFRDTCRGVMAQLPNSYFDDMLEEAGFTILKETHKRTYYESSIFNGQRSALVQRGNHHLERDHEWISETGDVFKWWLDYDGQPFNCRRCNIFHDDGKCPAWEKKKEERSWGGQQKCFFVSSSMLRLASDTKNTRIDSIPGAKVGHISNHLNNDTVIFAQAEAIAIHAGANMDMGSVESSKPHLEAQAKELAKVVTPLVEAAKNVFVIDPIAGKHLKEAENADHWAMVRKRMKRVAQETKAQWVSLENIDWIAEEDVAEDGHHYSVTGTRKVMEAAAAAIKAKTDIDALQDMDFQSKPYGRIYNNHYKVGCYRCTFFHERGRCPPLPDSGCDSSNSSSSGEDDSFSNSIVNSIINGDNNNEDNNNETGGAGQNDLEDVFDAAAAAASSTAASPGALQMTFSEMIADDPGRRASLGGPQRVTAAAAAAAAAASAPSATTLLQKETRARSQSANKRARENSDDSATATKDKKKANRGKKGSASKKQ